MKIKGKQAFYHLKFKTGYLKKGSGIVMCDKELFLSVWPEEVG